MLQVIFRIPLLFMFPRIAWLITYNDENHASLYTMTSVLEKKKEKSLQLIRHFIYDHKNIHLTVNKMRMEREKESSLNLYMYISPPRPLPSSAYSINYRYFLLLLFIPVFYYYL